MLVIIVVVIKGLAWQLVSSLPGPVIHECRTQASVCLTQQFMSSKLLHSSQPIKLQVYYVHLDHLFNQEYLSYSKCYVVKLKIKNVCQVL